MIFAVKNYSDEEHVNVGTGSDVSIVELARQIGDVVGWDGEFAFDPSMPDGVMRKLLDVSKLERLGWTASTDLREGIELTYASFLAEQPAVSGESR